MRLVNWMMDNRLAEAFEEVEEPTEDSNVVKQLPELSSAVSSKSLQVSATDGLGPKVLIPASKSTPASNIESSSWKATMEDSISVVRECLDTGAAFPAQLPPQAYGTVLLELLEGLIPAEVDIVNVSCREEAFEVRFSHLLSVCYERHGAGLGCIPSCECQYLDFGDCIFALHCARVGRQGKGYWSVPLLTVVRPRS